MPFDEIGLYRVDMDTAALKAKENKDLTVVPVARKSFLDKMGKLIRCGSTKIAGNKDKSENKH